MLNQFTKIVTTIACQRPGSIYNFVESLKCQKNISLKQWRRRGWPKSPKTHFHFLYSIYCIQCAPHITQSFHISQELEHTKPIQELEVPHTCILLYLHLKFAGSINYFYYIWQIISKIKYQCDPRAQYLHYVTIKLCLSDWLNTLNNLNILYEQNLPCPLIHFTLPKSKKPKVLVIFNSALQLNNSLSL